MSNEELVQTLIDATLCWTKSIQRNDIGSTVDKHMHIVNNLKKEIIARLTAKEKV